MLNDKPSISVIIPVYNMEKNSGSGLARNLGIEKATREFLAFMNPDDYYYNGGGSKQCNR